MIWGWLTASQIASASAETQKLYVRAAEELNAQFGVLVDDPFQGSEFNALRKPTIISGNSDASDLKSVPHDLHK